MGLWKEPRSTLWSKSSVPSISKDVFDSGTDISRTSTAEAMEAEDSATVSLIGLTIKKGNIKIGKNYVMCRLTSIFFLFGLILVSFFIALFG